MMKGEGSRKICGDEAGRTEEIERWTRQETKRKSKMGGGILGKGRKERKSKKQQKTECYTKEAYNWEVPKLHTEQAF